MTSRQPRIEIYRSERFAPDDESGATPEWRWRMRASNGRIVAESGEAYLEPRNLVRGLEIAHPGMTLVNAWVDGDLCPDRWVLVSATETIPVVVPAGTESLWRARGRR